MITKSTIDKIFSAVRIEEIIGEYVQLKRAGSNLKGLSPFVNEKSPSFIVSPSKQIFKDFSSGKGGGIITFLKEVEGFSYPEALRYLAKRYNIEVEEETKELTPEQKQQRDQKELIYKIHKVANDYFINELWETEDGNWKGLYYLRERGLTKAIVTKFQLGYSQDAKSEFTNFALSKGYTKYILEKSGLTIYPETAPNGIDRFRGRVMFPIHSFSGRVLGFGGRILDDALKTAKYLNSPETDIYHKSNILYGLFQSKQAISKENLCLLVEGYMDVVALHQFGIENVVASSGTALSVEQIKLIKRLTYNVTILFDGDKAGINASFRSIDLLLSEGMNIRVLLFPDGDDPDSFTRKHSKEYVENFIKDNAQDFIDFKAEILFKNTDNDAIKKSEAIREIVKSVACISNALKQEIYIKELATKFNLKKDNIYAELNILKGVTEQLNSSSDQLDVIPEQEVSKSSIVVMEEKLIAMMLKFGNVVVDIKSDNFESYKTTVTQEILHVLDEDNCEMQDETNAKILSEIRKSLSENKLLTSSDLLLLMDDAVSERIANILIDYHEVSDWSKYGIYFSKEEDTIASTLRDNILRYKREYILIMINNLKTDLEHKEEKQDIYIQITKLTQLRNHIDATLYRTL